MSELTPEPGGTSPKGDGATRRTFLGALVAGAVGAAGWAAGTKDSKRSRELRLRPPGALPDGEFESACVSCFKCGTACPNDCIRFHGLESGLGKVFTPYIKARTRGCTLCGECANICPSGALVPFGDSREGWLEGVDMGKAYVNEGLCYSFAGRTCGACYRACPLAGQAIKIGLLETPHVDRDLCVGCGLCEQSCLHLPQAIRVIPRENLKGPGA